MPRSDGLESLAEREADRMNTGFSRCVRASTNTDRFVSTHHNNDKLCVCLNPRASVEVPLILGPNDVVNWFDPLKVLWDRCSRRLL